jgi:hypothetical protein
MLCVRRAVHFKEDRDGGCKSWASFHGVRHGWVRKPCAISILRRVWMCVRACVRACMRACSKTCARFVSKSDARRLLIVCVCMRRRLPRRAMQHVRLVRRRAVERCIGGEGWHRCFVRVKASPFLASVLCAVLAVLTVVYSVRLRAAFVVS